MISLVITQLDPVPQFKTHINDLFGILVVYFLFLIHRWGTLPNILPNGLVCPQHLTHLDHRLTPLHRNTTRVHVNVPQGLEVRAI